jgi:hypothetical protein
MSQRAPQRLIANRYVIETILRQGRAGVVWRATDSVEGGAVAVEEIEPPVESEAERNVRWPRVVQAARQAAGLRHPGALKLLDVLLDGEHYFVVRELVEALTLSDLIDRHGQLPVRRVARIGLDVLDVLGAAHAMGFAHLDLQPAHVLVAADGGVRVGGFVVAAVLAPPRQPPVPAPEQLRGEPAGAPADLWALGAIMYEAVEGRSPFEDRGAEILYAGPRPSAHAGELGPLIEALLDRLPERRPHEAAVRERLREIAGPNAGPAVAPNGTSHHGSNGHPLPAALPGAGMPGVGVPGAGVPGLAVPAVTSTSTPPMIARARPPDGPGEAPTNVIAPGPLLHGRASGAVAPVGAARAGAAGRAARAGARARFGAESWRDAIDWMLDPTRRGLMVGVASVMLALLSFALIVALIGNPAGSGAQTSDALAPGPTSAPATTAAPTTTVAPTTTLPATTAPQLPAGWTPYADQRSGYQIAYPASWEVDQGDRGTEFHDRSVPTMMRVNAVPSPVPDPMAAQAQSSQEHAQRHQGSYQQTRLEPANFQGRPGALLEFTFIGDDQQPFRAVEIGTNTPPGPNGPGYWVTIFVQSRESDWGVAQSVLATALASFVPPPS